MLRFHYLVDLDDKTLKLIVLIFVRMRTGASSNRKRVVPQPYWLGHNA